MKVDIAGDKIVTPVDPVTTIIVAVTPATVAIAGPEMVKIVAITPATIAVADPVMIRFAMMTPVTMTTVDDDHVMNVVTQSTMSMI